MNKIIWLFHLIIGILGVQVQKWEVLKVIARIR